MANNRLVLICNHCNPGKWEYHTNGVFAIGKFYPATGWYTNRKNMAEDLDEFYEKHSFCHGGEYGKEWQFRMEYEFNLPQTPTSSPMP